MDNFCEQLITIKNATKKALMKFIGTFLIVLVGVIIFFFTWLLGNSFTIAILVLIGVIFLGIFFLNNLNYEYEYIFTNGELDIDKIIAKRKRKRILSVEVKNFSNFGKASEILNKKDSFLNVNASDGMVENIFFAEFNSSGNGQIRLFFSPNEKLLSHIKIYLPRNLRNF